MSNSNETNKNNVKDISDNLNKNEDTENSSSKKETILINDMKNKNSNKISNFSNEKEEEINDINKTEQKQKKEVENDNNKFENDLKAENEIKNEENNSNYININDELNKEEKKEKLNDQKESYNDIKKGNEEQENIERKLFNNNINECSNKKKNPCNNENNIDNFEENNEQNINKLKTTNNINFNTKQEENYLQNTLQTSKSSNIFVNSIKEEIKGLFLDIINISEKEHNKVYGETFCTNFFIASFPTENGKIIEKSENIMADCMHDMCSHLPAIEPEIIYKYPENNKNGCEINNLAASICFPNGIKLCYEEDEEKIRTVTNYRTLFTNELGDKFFAVTYHLFLKMKKEDFFNNYKLSSLKNELDELVTYQDKLNDKQLINRKNVYIPFCFCLISKYPFFEQMEKSLESIFLSIDNYNATPEKINNLITYLVKSIPLPSPKTQISFTLPFVDILCELQYPYFKDRLEFGDDPSIILEKLSINNILCFFILLIFEQKIFVVGKDNDIISRIISNFFSLIYPFVWTNTSIPLMSANMKKLINNIIPFFNGMNIALYEQFKDIILGNKDKIFIVNIDEDTIFLNTILRNKSKQDKINDYLNNTFGKLPKNIEKIFLSKLEEIKNDLNKAKSNKKKEQGDYIKDIINIRIKNLFLYIFVLILFDYDKYSYIFDDLPIFNSSLFVDEKPKPDELFYKEFTSTQLFQMFIQNSFSDDKNCYFNEYYQKYHELQNSKDIFINLLKKFENDYFSNFSVNRSYSINANILEKLNLFDNDSFEINKCKQYKSYINYFNERGILKENKRIIEHPISLSNEKDPKNYKIFVIQESEKQNIDSDNGKIENESNSKISIGNSNKKEKKPNLLETILKDSDLTDKEKYKIQIDFVDEIKAIVSRIYKSEVTKISEDKKKFNDCIKSKYARDYFINAITSGIKKYGTLKYLKKDLFECFKYIISQTLKKILDMNETKKNIKNIEYVVKLLKLCQYIKTVKDKKEMLLTDDIFPELENYSLFTEIEFWEKWVKYDMNENDFKILKLIKEEKFDVEDNNYKLYIKHSFEIIEKLPSIMKKIKLSTLTIFAIIDYLGKQYINDNKQFGPFMTKLINELNLKKD